VYLRKKGININKPKNLINYFEYFFGEDQGRYFIEINKNDLTKVKSILEKNSVYFIEFGIIQEKNIFLKDRLNVTIEELIDSNKAWLTKYMSN
jgi:phosphoribosylformylglycinamidine synthase